MIQPPLESTPIGTSTGDKKITHLESTPVDTKIPYPKTPTLLTEFSKCKEKQQKSISQRIQSHTHHCQINDRVNLIRENKYRKSKSKRRDRNKSC